ncbi:hypothetical protein IL992_14495 [Microbispora sp. NEAU-D428]|uniref:hypothetical protein n=1 Tax=Microbispora sitophila TaxID=2771537 RepID=UPI001865CB92|nr:hypothetical protein [Microbispora sitophila]MBE3010395.1 hypothetical protein [Microbispora sitophila]
MVAGLLLGGAVLAAGRMLWTRARSLAAAAQRAACMPAHDDLVVIEHELSAEPPWMTYTCCWSSSASDMV